MARKKKWNNPSNIIVDGKRKIHPIYNVWDSIMARCYRQVDKHPSYKGVTVCEEWQDYDNFYKWYEENYYEIPNEKMIVSFTLLNENCNVFSPDTCVIVPKTLQNLFVKPKQVKELPIGVIKHPRNHQYQASISRRGKYKNLGYYSTIEEAAKVYNKAKALYIMDLANEFKEYLPKHVYQALINRASNF